ncbi:hypothetical protein [Leptospira levettii]|uniref:hypothetical protein n=1 Tax=Leptospira levettii TaxID=2023178 RepID=UPI0010930657|nr:hypothetical protein [Leptospira levettii]
MKYIIEKMKTLDEINFLVKDIDRTRIPDLVSELSQFYILHSFISTVNLIKNENTDYLYNQVEVQRFEQLISQLRSDLKGIKIIPKITLEELMMQFPEKEKEFVEKYSKDERVNISKYFDSLLQKLTIESV